MIVRTRPEWKSVVERVRKSRDREGTPVFSYDVETRDQGYPDVHLVGFSLGWYNEDDSIGGAYVPIGHNTGEMQLRPEDVQDDLAELLEDESIEVVMHNAQYDVLVSRVFPRRIMVAENIFDTMVAAWLLNTNGVGSYAQIESGNGLKGLKDLSDFYFDYKMQELTDLAPKEKRVVNGVEFEDLRVDLVPIAKLGSYAYDDGVQTLKLRELFLWGYDAYDRPKRELSYGYRKLLPDVMVGLKNLPEVWRVFNAVEREFVFCLVDMVEHGVELDVKLLAQFREQVAEELRELRGKMFACRPGVDFEEGVDADLVRRACEEYDRLEELFQLPKDHPHYPKNKQGKPASKGWMRNQMFKAFGLEGHPVVEKIRDDKLRPDLKTYPHLAAKVFNVSSTQQLNRVLFDECECPPIGERSATGLWSTDKDSIKTWANQGYEMAQYLQRVRELDKLHGTYLVGMPAQVASDGRIRTRFGRVRTGRLSSFEPNLQNIPTSSEFPIRRAFVATGVTQSDCEVLEWYLDDDGAPLRPKRVRVENEGGGWLVDEGRMVEWWGENPPFVKMVADYSQLEIRLLAHISNDPVLIQAIKEGQDIHALTAQAVFDEIPKNISLDEVKKLYPEWRKKAKPVNFGIIYGMGPPALAEALGISIEEAERIINDRYMSKYKGVKRWIDNQHRFVHKHGYVTTATGRRRHLPTGMKDKKEYYGEVAAAERQAQNCVDAETEILTVDGWKRYDEISEGTVILTKNPETGGLEWHPIKKLCVFPQSVGRLVEFESETFSALTTEDHRWLVYNKNTGRDEFKLSREISVRGDHHIHRTGTYGGKEVYSDDFVELVGRFFKDGSLRSKRHLTLEMTNRLVELFPNRVLTPAFLQQLSGRQARLLVDVMLLGDGHEEAANQKSFTCDSEEQANLFQMLCVLAGYATTVTYRDMSKSGKLVPNMTGVWVVNILNRDKVTKAQMRVFESDGRLVWCPQVQNQTFVARRRGTVYITGNTPIQGFAADVIGFAMRDTRRYFRSKRLDVMNPAMVMPATAENGGTYIPKTLLDRDGEVLWGGLLRFLLQIHDELVGEAHPAVANFFMDESVRIMENAGGMKLRVPLKVDAALGANWFDTKE